MSPKKIPLLALALSALAALAVAPLAVADDDVVHLGHRLVVVDDGDLEATVRLDGDRLQVITRENGGTSVQEIDLGALGELVDEAVSGAMRQLEASLGEDLTITVDNGHMVNVKQGDRACGFDARLIAREVQRSLAGLHEELRRELGHVHDVHQDVERDEMAELETELNRLKAELNSLRDSLDRIR